MLEAAARICVRVRSAGKWRGPMVNVAIVKFIRSVKDYLLFMSTALV